MAQATSSAPGVGVENDPFQRSKRPWTIWVVVGIGLISNVHSLVADTSVWNAIATAIALALIAGQWRGNPGVRLYFIFTMFVLVAVSFIALLGDPSQRWPGFACSVAIFALLLAPPTHRWAQQQEQERELKKAQRHRDTRQGHHAEYGAN